MAMIIPGEELLKTLNKQYAPSSSITLKFKKYDVRLITNEEGAAIQAFIGKKNEAGIIRGDRFARTLKYDREGAKIKDHWERKGKAS
ncbi:MAG TPA: hypothetical protein VEY06_04080 [Flavisolibacter sp.]|jgi:hypothetical protein|nr:hypothetical protein [Flavisolibacter sp.]